MTLKSFFQNCMLFVLSCFFLFILLEICFRFLPVYEGFNFVSVDEDQPIFHALPDQDVTTSKGWDFYDARDVHINNVGFRNNQDYQTTDQRPLIGVIGDSYVEAVQVDYEDTFYGLLANALDDKARVYSFGYSGAPLSQYLVWAQYAEQTFNPDALTFVIISNDFDESLGWWKRAPGFHQYERCEIHDYCLERFDYKVGWSRPIIKMSALARYMIYNLQALQIIQKIKLKKSAQTFVGNAPSQVSNDRLEDSLLAVDLFFNDLPSYTHLSPGHINFIIDGRLYDQSREAKKEFEQSFFGIVRRYFIETATEKGYHVIDMKPVFSKNYISQQKKFETIRDGHWNALGHSLVSDQLHQYYRTQF